LKIIHTSDWHIGKKLYETKLEEDHQHFFSNLEKICIDENADVLLIAGDIFDHAYPSNSSLEIYYNALMRFRDAGLKQIIVTGGNHDSVATLQAPEIILNALNITVVAGVSQNENGETDYDKEIIEIKDNKGNTELVICAVPFLRDKDIRLAVAGESHVEKNQSIKLGIDTHFNELGKRVKHFREQKIPVLAVAHLFTAGASTSDSEREIYAGNLLKTESDIFSSNFDYTALGHIHRPQIIGGNENVRYSGSPIPLSFSERKDNKCVILIETLANGELKITNKNLNSFRKLIRISGTLLEVQDTISKIDNTTEVKDLAEILVEEDNHRPDILSLTEKLISETKHLKIIHYRIKFTNSTKGTHELFDENLSITDIDDEEVFLKRLESEIDVDVENYIHLYKELKGTVLAEI